MTSSKRKQFSIEEKLKILQEVDRGRKKGDVAKEFNITPSTLSTFLKHRQKIEENASNFNPSRKRMRDANYDDVDKATYEWFLEVRSKNIPISGPLVMEKAKQFATMLECDAEFKGTTGWLKKFRKRHGIVFKEITGEEMAADKDAADEWRLTKMKKVLDDYQLVNIFNADETALFFQLLPEKTLAVKGDRCKGGKKSKQRITILFCCNADGTERLRPLVIGKYAKPRAFKNTKSLPADYVANSKAWMTAVLFNEWLLKINNTMKRQKRKIAMIVDNCSAHNKPPPMSNVEMLFFPPNCTSIMQPLDQGIIRSAKCHYRTRMLQRILLNIQLNRENATTINILQAIEMATGGWWSVTGDVIRNCWRKAGFVRREEVQQVIANENSTDEEEDEDVHAPVGLVHVRPNENSTEDEDEDVHVHVRPNANISTVDDELNAVWNEYAEREQLNKDITLEDYLDADTDALIAAEMNEEDIVREIQESARKDRPNASDASASDDDEVIDVVHVARKLTTGEAVQITEELQQFLSNMPDVPDELLINLDRVRSYCVKTSFKQCVQKTIRDYMDIAHV